MAAVEVAADASLDNVSYFNISSEPHGGEGTSIGMERVVIPCLFTFVVVLGVIGNTLVLVVVLKNQSYRQTTTNLYILNLSIADLLFLIFCVPFHAVIYTVLSWPFGKFMCKFAHLFQFLSMIASVLTMVAMSTERFMAIVYPIRTKHMRTPLSALFVSILTWVVAAMVAFPFPIVYIAKERDTGFGESIIICADDWQIIGASHDDKAIYFLMLFLLSYMIPLVIIVLMSVLTIRHLSSSNPVLSDTAAFKESTKTKKRVIRLIIVTQAVFLFCWLPAHLCWIWSTFGRESLRTPSWTFYYLKVCAHALSYSNSAANPVIYCFMSATFRKGFMKALGCFRYTTRSSPRNSVSKTAYTPCTTDNTLETTTI